MLYPFQEYFIYWSQPFTRNGQKTGSPEDINTRFPMYGSSNFKHNQTLEVCGYTVKLQ